MRKVPLLMAIASVALAGQYDLLIGHTDPGMTSGVMTNIAGDPFYDSVTFEDWRSSTPTVNHLDEFGCVFFWTSYNPDDQTGLGDNLADYLDNGGTVVLSVAVWDASWGMFGRIMTDDEYAPITHLGSMVYTDSNLGDYDSTHPFMDGVDSITGIFFWFDIEKEAPAIWVADISSAYILCAVNLAFNCAGLNMTPSDYKMWSGDGWILYNNVIQSLMEGGIPPYVDEIDPGDGEEDVPVEALIIFHCKTAESGVDTSTIVFTVEERDMLAGSLNKSAAVEVGKDYLGGVPGTLDIDDTDPFDVICTFTADNFLLPPFEEIICNVDGGLANLRGNEMGDDFVWHFYTEGYQEVEETTWGAIKAEF